MNDDFPPMVLGFAMGFLFTSIIYIGLTRVVEVPRTPVAAQPQTVIVKHEYPEKK